MTKEALAEKLNRREIGEEVLEGESDAWRADGLLVIFGASDDLAELRGLIDDEVGCYDGGEFLVHRGGVMSGNHECDCDHCGFKDKSAKCLKVEAVWCGEKPYSWTYKTEVPHAMFVIMEDGGMYCRGIVIDGKDLPTL